jgi:hypothetical protein
MMQMQVNSRLCHIEFGMIAWWPTRSLASNPEYKGGHENDSKR